MKKGIFRCMDFDTNHPKLIIAAVACDRNGLTNEAAAFSVRLSAFLFGAPRRCIKRWRWTFLTQKAIIPVGIASYVGNCRKSIPKRDCLMVKRRNG